MQLSRANTITVHTNHQIYKHSHPDLLYQNITKPNYDLTYINNFGLNMNP